jgi:hypothetical protein
MVLSNSNQLQRMKTEIGMKDQLQLFSMMSVWHLLYLLMASPKYHWTLTYHITPMPSSMYFHFPFILSYSLYTGRDHLTMAILTILTMSFQINLKKKTLNIRKKSL